MINFRYHIVSIVAVFLALAIGIVLGSTELQGTAINWLNRTSNDLTNDLHASQAQDRALQQQVIADQEFAQADEARLLDGLLDGQRVVVVAAPGAPASVLNGVTSAVHQAGATVTGQVSVQPKLLDASESNLQFLSSLVQQLVLPDGTATSGSPLQQAAQLLGSAILTRNDPSGSTSSGDPGESPATRQNVLSSYAQAGLLSVSGSLSSSQSSVPATLAIVVTPATAPSGGDADPANQGLITLAQQLNAADLATAMAGSVSGSGAGSAINALRGSSAASQISTVDDADTVVGQIITVQALARELAGHKGGSYGEDPGNAGAAPSPAPVPSSSASGQAARSGANAAKPGKGRS